MKLHIGCGPIHLEGWVNIDIQQSHMPGVCMDCLQLSDAFGEGTVDLIFSCHMLEHLDYPDGAVRFFEQTFKVLKPGGTLRIVVPDLYAICRGYLGGSDLKFIHGPDFPAYYHKSESRAERLHFFVSGKRWEHQICFDFELLEMLMKDAGFSNIRWQAFGVSDVPELCGIDRFESESLVVECVK